MAEKPILPSSAALIHEVREFELFRQKLNHSIRENLSHDVHAAKKLFEEQKMFLVKKLLSTSFSVYKDIKNFSDSHPVRCSKPLFFGDKRTCCLTTIFSLKVYKRALDSTTTLVCADFIIPVTPQQYSSYASSLIYRHEWDAQLDSVSLLEPSVENTDVCYVSLKGFGTVAPRDCINLRVIKQLDHEDRQRLELSDDIYCSCSCSIEYPKLVETRGNKVRADVKLGCYFVEPYQKDGSEIFWSKVYLFCDIDPRGWIPSIATKHVSANVLPRTVANIIAATLKHYGVNWKNVCS